MADVDLRYEELLDCKAANLGAKQDGDDASDGLDHRQPDIDPKDEKKIAIRKVIKEKLALQNIGDLVLCDVSYNYGLFGCNHSVEDVQPKSIAGLDPPS